jgi:hypothetical protein
MVWGERELIIERLCRRLAGRYGASLLIVGLLSWPLTIFAATPTPPTNAFPPGYSTGVNQGAPGAGAPPGARVGPTNPQQTMAIGVALKVQDQHGLDTFLHDLYDLGSPQFHHYLSAADFTKRFIASGRQPVLDFLKTAKLSANDRGVGSIIDASGTVAQIEAAFKVTISDYQDPTGAVVAQADSAPTLPASVAGYIQAIIGLDNIIQLKTHADPAPTPDAGAAPAAPTPGAAGCVAALNVAST